ncbi:glycosyltransferase [Pantoea sp. B65]|uniref:glycosyltransferase n=1 Tax=Pantoea sp. B65 TaxID=2813359 RepID=UPI0039B50198
MRIVIDMQGWQGSSQKRGIGRYTISLIKEFVQINKADEIILSFNGAFKESIKYFRQIVKNGNFKITTWFPVAPDSCSFESNKWNHEVSEEIYKNFHNSLAPDFLLITSMFEGLGDNCIIDISEKRNYLTGVILYDLIPFIHPDIYLDNDVLRNWYDTQCNHLKKSDFLLSISASARNEATKHLNWDETKVINISAAADDIFRPIIVSDREKKEIENRLSIRDNFLMFTGGEDPRKNMEKLIESYSLLPANIREKHQLVIVCSITDGARSRLYSLGKSLNLQEGQLVITGYVSNNDLVTLYNLCHAFIFPSWHEGFGLPVLEAMLCEKPVITSNVSSLPEVINYKDALFDPTNQKDIADKMHMVLTNDNFREQFLRHSKEQVKVFSWNISAQKLANAINQFISSNQKPTLNIKHNDAGGKIKKRLALFSPMPPEQSGISHYCVELLPSLARFYDISIVHDNAEVIQYCKKNGLKTVTTNDFKTNASLYDRVVYQFGNSYFHQHMTELLQAYPGVVILHDFFLSGLYNHAVSLPNSYRTFNDILYESHGYNAVICNNEHVNNEPAIVKYPCNKLVFEAAKSIIFHSTSAINLTKKWYAHRYLSKLNSVPLLRKNARFLQKSEARKKLNIDTEEIVIISLGFPAPTKLNHLIIESFDMANISHKKTRLVFVGQKSESEYANKLNQLIADSRGKNSIFITGWVSEDQYKLWLNAADIGIQLRTMSRGETSATVLDCMNYGLATIANAHGSMSELDPSAVVLLKDQFTVADLKIAIEKLVADEVLRNNLGEQAKKVIENYHAPDFCAKKYHEIIEKTYLNDEEKINYNQYKSSILVANDSQMQHLAQSLANTFPANRDDNIYIDITLSQQFGISNELQDFLFTLSENIPESMRIEPVRFSKSEFIKAMSFSSKVFDISRLTIIENPTGVVSGAHFIIYNPTAEHLLNIADYCYMLSTANRITFLFWEEDIVFTEQWLAKLAKKDHEIIIDLLSIGDVCFPDNIIETSPATINNHAPLTRKWQIKHLSAETYPRQLIG